MCGSYQCDLEKDARFEELLEELRSQGQMQVDQLAGQLFPNNDALVLIAELGEIKPVVMRWGFPGFSGRKYIYNARIETVDVRPMFASSIQTRRCAIPATGFFEWSSSRDKYEFRLPEKDMYLAGIFNEYEECRRFCILTTEANNSVISVHNRMPVVLDSSMLEDYLTSYRVADQIVHAVPPALESRRIKEPGRKPLFEQVSLFSDGEREL